MKIRGAFAAAAITVCAGCSSSTTAPATTGLRVDIAIANGTGTPANAALQGKVWQPITLNVSSDAVDELHAHSVPDHEFPVEARTGQMFQFVVDVPGQMDVELHDLDRTVASIQVQP